MTKNRKSSQKKHPNFQMKKKTEKKNTHIKRTKKQCQKQTQMCLCFHPCIGIPNKQGTFVSFSSGKRRRFLLIRTISCLLSHFKRDAEALRETGLWLLQSHRVTITFILVIFAWAATAIPLAVDAVPVRAAVTHHPRKLESTMPEGVCPTRNAKDGKDAAHLACSEKNGGNVNGGWCPKPPSLESLCGLWRVHSQPQTTPSTRNFHIFGQKKPPHTRENPH